MESPFSVIDAIIIIFTVLSAILAMARGLTREILGVASFIGASFVGIHNANLVSPVITSMVNLQPLADKFSSSPEVIGAWIGGILLFVIVWIIFTIITSKLSKYISDSSVSGVDSTLGFAYGLARGLFIIGITYNMYTHFVPPEKYHHTVAQSRLKPVLDTTSDVIINVASLLLPEKVAEGFSKRQESNYANDYSTEPDPNDIITSTIRSNSTL